MPQPSPTLLRRVAAALLLCFLPTAASAVEHEVRILMDLDDDAGTGCLVNTVAGPLDGVDQILITTVETSSPPEAGTVTDVATSDCIDEMTDTFSAPASFDGGWPVGIGNGVGGRDVVETYFPLVSSVVDSPMTVRLGVVVTDENGGEQALLTEDGSPDGPPILLVVQQQNVIEIPTLGEWGLILLALLLAAASFRLLGRRGSMAMVAVLALLGAGVAWAAVSLDGLTGEWSSGDQLGSNGIVLFGMVEGDNICFRVDVDLVFNSGPDAVDDGYGTDEDTVVAPAAPGVLGNDTDPDSDPLTVSDHDPMSAQGAVVNVNADGSFSYDPTGAAALQALDDGESLDDTFGYTASDGTATDTATVTVTVDGVNDAPTAMDDMFMATEDTPLVIAAPGVLVNDDDVDGETITAVLDTDVSNGTLTLNADGSFTYTPDLDFNGVDSFTYHATDGDADSAVVTVTITVGAVNDGPNAVDDSFMTGEDAVLNEPAPGVLTNDTDPEMDPLTVTAADTVSTQGASVTVNADGSFSYDPTGAAALQALDDGEMLDDTFTYTVDDGSMNPDTATVTVTVTGANDAPVADDDGYSTDEDVTLNVPAAGVLGNDTDVDVETLNAVIVSAPSNADAFVLNADGSFSYTPAANFNGMDSFTYRANDGTVSSNLATVTITVNPVNDPPVAVDDSVTAACNLEHVVETDPGQTAAGGAPVFRTLADNVLADDSDPVEMSAISIVEASGLPGGTTDSTGPDFTITTNEGGSVTLHADGSFIYTPEGGDRGVADTFTYTIQDAEGAQGTATVTLNVANVCVWFVDNSAGADDTGSGTSSDPFTSLVDELGPDALPDDAEDASQAGDVIYVFEGDSRSGDPYDGNFTAEANERILGQGVDLVVDLGGGPETLFTGNPANRPMVEGVSAGVAVSVIDVTGVEVAGLEMIGGDNSFTATSITAAMGFELRDNVMSGATTGAIVIDQNGEFDSTATVTGNQVTSSTGGAILAEVSAGTFELALDDNTGLTSTGSAIELDGSGGSLYLTSFCGNSVSGDTTGTGIQAIDVIFDADPADANFTGDEVSCGTGTTIGSSGNPVGGFGMVLDGVTGDLDLGQLDVYAGTAGGGDETALEVFASGAFDAGLGTGFQLSANGGTVSAIDGPAIDIDPTDLEGFVLTTVTSQNSATVGIGLTEVSGSFTVTGITTIGSTGGDGVAVTDSSAAVTFTGPLTISGTGGEGVSLDDLVGAFSAADATSTITGTTGDAFNSLSSEGNITYAGTIANTSNNSVDIRNHGGAGAATTILFSGAITDSGAGVFLTDNDQGMGTTIDFTGGLDLDTGANEAFVATEGGTVNVLSDGVSTTADTTTGTLVRIVNTTIGAGGVTFDSTSKTGGADGIVLTQVGSGDFLADAGSIVSQTNRGVDVSGGSGDITIDPSISTTTTGRSVEVTTHTGGTVDFNGAIDDDGLGIRLANNVGTVLRFDGGMDVDTSAGSGTEEGLEATGGGVLHVTGTNTVNTSLATGIAVNISGGTTIGADGVTFQNVSANGAPSGIVLDSTGTAGNFTVTGDGSTGAGTSANNDSGGTIQNTTGDGVQLTNVANVFLDQMRIEDAADHGIDGSGVTDLTLTRANLVSNGTVNQEHGLNLLNPAGTITVTNILGDGNFDAHLRVFSQTGNDLTLFTVDDSVFQNVTTGFFEDGISFETQTGVNTAISVTDSTFANHDGDHVQASSNGSAVMDVVITGNTMTGAAGNLGAGITVNSAGSFSGTTTFDVSGNDLQKANDNSASINVNIGTSTAAGSYTGTIGGNTIGTVGNADSAGDTGIAVEVNQDATMTVAITGNVVREFDNFGIDVGSVDGTGTVNATVTGNTVTSSDANVFAALFVDSQTNNVTCADIGGAGALENTLSASAGFTDVAFQTGGSGVVNLESYGGAANNQAQIQTYIQGRNTGTPGVQLNVGGGSVQGGGACPTP